MWGRTSGSGLAGNAPGIIVLDTKRHNHHFINGAYKREQHRNHRLSLRMCTMDALIQSALEYIKNYNWSSPFTFIIVVLLGLLILKKFSMFLIVLATVVIGWGAQDLMITSATSNKEIVSLPLIIYGVGGVAFIVLSLISFYRSS